jgi:PPM family protein phosphatase
MMRVAHVRLPGEIRGGAIEVAAATHPGCVRKNNEDSVRVEMPTTKRARSLGTLCVVADGLGGHAAGEVASALAVQTVHEAFFNAGQGRPVMEALGEAIRAANQAVWEAAARLPGHAGMASTLTAAVVQGHDLTVGHVGDSRAYLIRNGAITQLTTDHSWVAERIAMGRLTPEQAARHPRRNVVSRVLGAGSTVEVDLCQHNLQAGDVVLICSDGLSRLLSDEEIAEPAGRLRPTAAADQLIGLALERGAPDNASVALVRVGDRQDGWRATHRGARRALGAAVVIALALAALMLLPPGGEPDERLERHPSPAVVSVDEEPSVAEAGG